MLRIQAGELGELERQQASTQPVLRGLTVPRSVASDNAANSSPDRTAELPAARLAGDAPDSVTR